MRFILTVALCILISVSVVFAQVEQEKATKEKESATKLELFLAKKGMLVIKDFYSFGIVNGLYDCRMEFKALVAYEPGREQEKLRGLQITITKSSRFERSDESFLDFEEIESLSTALQYMIDLAKKWQNVEKEHCEVEFSTKGDFQTGFIQVGTKQTGFASSGRIGATHCFFSGTTELTTVKGKVDAVIELLNKK